MVSFAPPIGHPRSRPRGRPKKADAPKVPWDVVDRALVHGEKRTDFETGAVYIEFPSMEELGKRYGVSRNRVWQYATKNKCLDRRKETKVRAQHKYDVKVAEKKAEARALATEDVTAIVDSYIENFRQQLDGGNVRADSPADFDRLVRLKELLQGNADSRQSIEGTLSLESIQERHHRLRTQLEALSGNPALEGVNDEDDGPSTSKDGRPGDVH
jgi:hypothetical protein